MAGELGAVIPQSGGSEAPQPTWQSMVNDPVSRAAMMSFGLQLMTGGWGSGLSQIGQAGGKAAEAAGKTAGAIQEQGNLEIDRANKEKEGEANRSNQLAVAKTAAASREEVAGIRADSRKEIETMKLQKAPSSVAIKYLTEARKIIENNVSNMSLSNEQREVMIRELANRLYSGDADRGLVPAGTPGAAPGAVSGEGGAKIAGEKPATESKGASKPWDQYINIPGVAEALKDPAFRERLGKEHPEYKTRIQLYERENMARDARKNLYGIE